MSLSTSGLLEICGFLVNIAKQGGKIITSAHPSSSDFAAKKNSADIVTETDTAVECMVQAELKSRYPTFDFVGEETYKTDQRITEAPTFIVDPIDGTANFVHGFPAVCISLGFVVGRKPTVGVVFNPFLDELYTAVKGCGAFYQRADSEREKLPLLSSPLRGLGPACIGIEWGSDREGVNFELNLKVFTTLARTRETGGRFVNSLRCTGSSAITICRVAAGQQDLFWECGNWAWDVAAAWCILNEAGGMIVDGHPGEWDPPINNRRYLAVRPAPNGQKEIVQEFWDVIGDDRSTYGPPQ
ncbi:Inositol monophosphatase 2 [Lasiodiplodia hormozganensis]|uniref:Inositol-1-monophosphatase n=1 Tax=Lasiodiplodia hormozganensis TaxID=869390 RepID=A0AA39XTP1_9PEZI|nr:Inositol monophosphatase 2 [Lasiodiplodia hormozganensis]